MGIYGVFSKNIKYHHVIIHTFSLLFFSHFPFMYFILLQPMSAQLDMTVIKQETEQEMFEYLLHSTSGPTI